MIDEAALLRPVGTATVMTAQLDHLAQITTRTVGLTIQVLSLETPWPVISGPFALLTFASPDDPGAASTPGTDEASAAVTSHPATVRRLDAAFTALAHAALPPTESARLITSLGRRAHPLAASAGARPPP